MAKAGLVIAAICVVISCTELGLMFQMTSYSTVISIDSYRHPDQTYTAGEGNPTSGMVNYGNYSTQAISVTYTIT